MTTHDFLVRNENDDDVTAVTITDIRGEGQADRIRRQIEQVNGLTIDDG